MALATQCPHCHTTFRVANDQLKLHAGIVRCGACQQTFNGVEHLLAPNVSMLPAAAAPQRATTPASAATTTIKPEPPTLPSAALVMAATEVPPEQVAAPAVTAESHQTNPDSILVLPIDGKTEPEISDEEHERLDLFLDIEGDWDVGKRQVSDPLFTPIAENEKELNTLSETTLAENEVASHYAISDISEDDDATSAAELPSFVTEHAHNKKRKRLLAIVYGSGSLLLLLALMAQFTYIFRNQVAANYPATKPYLQQACAALPCQISLLSQIDALTVDGNELQALPAADNNLFSLDLQLRNHSNLPQNWPSIELTLNDAKDRPVLRRVFSASEYIANRTDITTGFAANSEHSIKLYFALNKVKAAGYHLEIFYP